MFHPVLNRCLRLFGCCLVLVSAPTVLASFSMMRPAVSDNVDMVLVEKSARVIYLMQGDNIVRSYPIALGKNPKGHKQQAGDGRTPEGRYTLDWRNPNSRYYRSIHISYPNEQDLELAETHNRDPGNLIMIHGSPAWVPSPEWASQWLHKDDWTEGCIAVTNDVMDEIWNLVKDGTPIEIRP